MFELLRALRPYQWTKNVLVFAALVFAQDLGDPRKVLLALGAFVVFCAASSSVYLFNDIVDRERDRIHPGKRDRPIAAGRVGVGAAATIAVILGAGALAAAWAIRPQLAAVIAGYLLLQLAYNIGLKHIAIVDALCVAVGFLLRAVAGAAAIDEPMSRWLLVCATFASVFISFAKRRHEFSTLTGGATEHRESLSGYRLETLDQFLVISAGATLLSYALYTADAETVEKFGDNRLLLTLPLVMYGLFHYLDLVQRDEAAGDPAAALLHDRPLAITVLLYAALVVVLLYL
ncbi:MAG: decaprenyl-phosphate phosphoribosyltransferase [Acidobacteriota bacterium]|jgi:4-hydroxybenzoate polyprenyltransferase